MVDTTGPDRMDARITCAADTLCREVIRSVHAMGDKRRSTRAMLALFTRLAGSWQSLCALAEPGSNPHQFEARAYDCAAIMRCMYDALLQLEHICKGPSPEKLGFLYLHYEHIERFQAVQEVLKQHSPLANIIKTSPKRPGAEPRVIRRYERVRHFYTHGKKGKVREHWYEDNLRKIAKDLVRENEWVWLCRSFNSAIHSGPCAMFHGPMVRDPRQVEQIALLVVSSGAGCLVSHTGIKICDESRALIDMSGRSFEDFQGREAPN